MFPNSALARVVEATQRAQRHWCMCREAAEVAKAVEAAPPLPLTVALSREAGTPAAEVAHEIGRRLGWVVYDHELLDKIAEEMGLRTQLLESLDERHIGPIREAVDEMMEALAGVPRVSEGTFVRHLLETVLSLGAHGECVVVGRGAAFILPPATTLRVRLTASQQARIEAIRLSRGLSEREARHYVEHADRERAAFVRNHFRGDPSAPGAYDLILDSTRFMVHDCAEIIVGALRCFHAGVCARQPTEIADLRLQIAD